MLNQLERHAQRLAFLKIPVLLLALVGFIHFVFTLEIPGILLTFWALLVFTFLSLFQNIPEAIPRHQGFFIHFKSRIKRITYVFLAVLLISLSLVFVGMTLRGLIVYFNS